MNLTGLKAFSKSTCESLGLYVRKSRGLPIGVDLWFQLKTRFNVLPANVFDVGGHRGETIAEIRHQFPQAKIHSFEPFPENFKVLNSRFSDDSMVRSHNFAIGSVDSEMELYVHSDSQTHSLVPSGFAKSKLKVSVKTIDSFLTAQAFKQIDILKIDTEGFELDVLKGGERAIADGRISAIVCEASLLPDDTAHSNLGTLQQFLGEYQYSLCGLFDQVAWSSPFRLAYFNALFIRDSSR